MKRFSAENEKNQVNTDSVLLAIKISRIMRRISKTGISNAFWATVPMVV